MKDIKINVGQLEVLCSGIVSSVNGEPIVLEVDPRIVIRIVFEKTDANEGASIIKTKLTDKGELEYTLQNFNNPLGTEFTQLAEIGTYNGRRLLFHVKVLGHSNSDNKSVIYTFYLRGEVTNG